MWPLSPTLCWNFYQLLQNALSNILCRISAISIAVNHHSSSIVRSSLSWTRYFRQPHTLRSGECDVINTVYDYFLLSCYQVVINCKHCRCTSKLHGSFIWRASAANDILLLNKDERSFRFWASGRMSDSDQTLGSFLKKFCKQDLRRYNSVEFARSFTRWIVLQLVQY